MLSTLQPCGPGSLPLTRAPPGLLLALAGAAALLNACPFPSIPTPAHSLNLDLKVKSLPASLTSLRPQVNQRIRPLLRDI